MKGFAFTLMMSLAVCNVDAQWDPHWLPNRSAMVHLFEWKWSDIASECENYLAPNGFGGVQISPPTENTAIYIDWLSTKRPWWERYQTVSYKLETRSGNEAAFADMTRRCNAVGVRIYADILLNHMSATTGSGTGSSFGSVNETYLNFASIPFTTEHFNPFCPIDWNSKTSIRDCWLGLPDLNLTNQHVRDKQIEMLNHLIDLGVAGFRLDAMKHMWPADVEYILSRMKNLSTAYGFPTNLRPFVVGEVIQAEGILFSYYTHLCVVTVFAGSRTLGQSVRGLLNVNLLKDFGRWFGAASNESLIFVDNHDNQREDRLPFVTHREPRLYKAATAFNLAFDFGIPRLMSSFFFETRDQGPPADADFNILSPTFDADDQCTNGWVCEHRWKPIKNMVAFRNAVKGTKVEKWWDGSFQIGFSRGDRGYFILNPGDNGLSEKLQTGMSAGDYCDMATGEKIGNKCSGKTVTVGFDGFAQFDLQHNSQEMFMAIHVDAKL